MTVTLTNQFLTCVIDDLGAQLCSVQDAGGVEYIWQADPAIWGRHAPLLFPVIGRLQDGQYTHKGQTYAIPSHGFARDSRFDVVEHSQTQVVFRLTHSTETLAVYPFPFTLTVTYRLEENRLTKTCRVENPGEEEMLFELGAHDGFRAPLAPGETMDDYAVLFPGLEAITPYGMDENCMTTPKGASIPLPGGRLPLKPSTFGLDTVILDQLPQRTAVLVDKSGRPRVTLEFPDFPYLGIWTQGKPFDTNYVCIEPWSTLPDAVFVGRALADKQGIQRLAPGQSQELSYTTTFQEVAR